MFKFLEKHWNGEYPLWRSYWINSVLIGNVAAIAAAFGVGLILGILLRITGLQVLASVPGIAITAGWLGAIPVYMWSIRGTWKAADVYIGIWRNVTKVVLVLSVIRIIVAIVTGYTN